MHEDPILIQRGLGAYWEDGPPVDVGDLIDNSMPILYRKMVHKRITADIAKADQYAAFFGVMRIH